MPNTAPLHGMRIIECSALGPAQITTPLVDLGAEVIKVEPPSGDYIREMTWPIVEGVSLMHLHLNRGKRSLSIEIKRGNSRKVVDRIVAQHQLTVPTCRTGT
jgi:crotonobetainyl-CoA:carnitine CoA-transferase CaiB-like acyl-CoA transferase